MAEKDKTDNNNIEEQVEAESSEISEESESEKEETVQADAPEPPDMEKMIEAAREEAKENYDRFLRLSAEFDNYKKRSTREMDSFRKFANESIVKELLPVVDNLERAIDSSSNGDGSEDSIVEGINMTLKEIMKVLEKYGVQPVQALEKPFDPTFHEAVMQEESEEHGDNTVIKEFQKGYVIHDRLLRPAMVVVAKAIEKNEEQEITENGN
ncbi:MAG: nucleotide exchange factor GrpE [Desulfobacteraceae bacterium]|nr:nucleotide exchange factor GrpE [Desulfobacteraceae bacterium]